MPMKHLKKYIKNFFENSYSDANAPSIQYSQVVGDVNKGDRLTYIKDTDKIDSLNEPWYEVKFNDVDNCYIYGGYFQHDSYNTDIYETDKLSEEE